MKKYKVIIGDDVFECDAYFHHNTCIEFLKCGNEDYNKIIPTNVIIKIYPIKKK
ncbi:hypothetical protein LGK95_21880 [Clostridium algoriphilum]|uniref:hypothetical protein n=1 Tax=Clostridium algoriphilum TaxID=198347 RepID=UPI001CF23D15|nr:hypothetical protein [Clostridium algoriphilum]MCB2296103.1 hypothetical protein [Clostridium algoriphilum]